MRKGLGFCLFLLLLFLCTLNGYSADEGDASLVGVKEKGVFFNVAEDRRIEKIGGLHQPEGLDVYLKRHLDRIDVRIGKLENEIKDMRSDIVKLTEAITKNPLASPDKKNK